MDNFIRAEVTNEGHSYNYMQYFWKCNQCGCEFSTKQIHNITGYCPSCVKKNAEERKEKAKARETKNAFGRVKRIFKQKFNVSQIPTISIEGVKYYQEKAFKKALDEIFNECMEGDRK